MTIVINAIDEQFAASTGSNVNSGAGTSTFDYPPTSTTGLTITSQEGDPEPQVFDPGDTYTLTFSGHGGTTIEDAVVIRSDLLDPGPGHAVVFEGLDSSGELTQVVWSPEFDLESWYFDNFSEGQSPGFYTTDQGTASYQTVCFEATMLIDTPSGARVAEGLRVGDFVNTEDAGPQKIQWVGRRRMRGWGRNAPVSFEQGVIGNSSPLILSPQHRILVKSPKAFAQFGSDEVLVPAVAFVNGTSVRIQPQNVITYVHILLEDHHILTAQNVKCESLLLGKMSLKAIAQRPELKANGGAAGMASDVDADVALSWVEEELVDMRPMTPARRCLTVREGMTLNARIAGTRNAPVKNLLSPGRKNMHPYRIRQSGALSHWDDSSPSLPSCAAIYATKDEVLV